MWLNSAKFNRARLLENRILWCNSMRNNVLRLSFFQRSLRLGAVALWSEFQILLCYFNGQHSPAGEIDSVFYIVSIFDI